MPILRSLLLFSGQLTNVADSSGFRLAKQLGMKVVATLGHRLVLLYDKRVGFGIRILADPRDLP